MSEPHDAIPAQYHDGLTLTGDQTAAMRQQWIGLGLDPAAFDQAANPPPPAAAPKPDGEPAEAPPAVEIMSDMKTPSLSPAQAEELVAEMIRAGIPEAKVREALEADGYTLTVPTDERG
jgi:hypothetical protein